MGGWGSGRHGWLPVVEDCLVLDLRVLRRQGLFRPDTFRGGITISWDNCHASAGICYDSNENPPPYFTIKYSVPGKNGERLSIEDKIYLERFPQPFGGFRYYFICPSTGKRAQCLYSPPGSDYFRSRHAFHGRLQYRSQQIPLHWRYLEQSQKVRERVLRAGPPDWRKWADVGGDFPPKPPRMRWATYNKLKQRYEYFDRNSYSAISTRWQEKLPGSDMPDGF
jgi:hypothetical protein